MKKGAGRASSAWVTLRRGRSFAGFPASTCIMLRYDIRFARVALFPKKCDCVRASRCVVGLVAFVHHPFVWTQAKTLLYIVVELLAVVSWPPSNRTLSTLNVSLPPVLATLW